MVPKIKPLLVLGFGMREKLVAARLLVASPTNWCVLARQPGLEANDDSLTQPFEVE